MLLASDFAVSLLTFLGVFSVVVAADSLFFDLRRHAKRNDDSLARSRQAERNRQRVHEAITLGELSALAARTREAKKKESVRERLQLIINQADGITTPGRFWVSTAASAAAGGVFAFLWSRNSLIGFGGLLAFAAIPIVLLVRARNQRKEKLLLQLSDTFGLMSRVMRAGQSVTQAMESVSEELTPPVSQEFLYCSERIKLGMEPGAALQQMAERTGLTELRIFVLAVNVHRSCGGNLVALIDLLEHLVRERFRIRGMVGSLTAQGRTQSVILVAMPLIAFGGFWLSNPEQSMKLFEYEWMIWTAVGLMVVGFFWVQRICKIEL